MRTTKMAEQKKGIENKPYLLFLNQIEVLQENSGTAKSIFQKVANSLKDEWKCNLVLPLVCLTDEEDKYRLLTGLPIYEAAKTANIEQMWVFLIAAKQADAEKAIEQVLLQSKLNERVFEPRDIQEFLHFLNTSNKSALTSIAGIKDGYAKLISDNRPYSSQEDIQKKLGAKRSLNWLRAYKQAKN